MTRLRFLRSRKGRAISEVLGSLIVIGITLVAGTAMIGFVNGQAASSANQYGSQVQTQINALGEKFSLVNTYFSCSTGSPCVAFNEISISVYNSGVGNLTVLEISIQDITAGSAAIVYQGTTNNGPAGCSGGTVAVSPDGTNTVSTPIASPPSTRAVQSFTLLLPTGVTCPTGLSTVFIRGDQYQIFVLGTNGFSSQQVVTK